MKRQSFWGLDISKKTIDLCIIESGQVLGAYSFENSPSKIRMAISSYLAQTGLNWDMCVFCMENTGIYTNHLLDYLTSNSKAVYVVNPLHLKKSMGLVRGKNDRVDALRIARFISKNDQDLQPYTKPEETIKLLKILSTHRTQLVKQLMQVKAPVQELKGCVDKRVVKQLEKLNEPMLVAIKQAIKAIDGQIKQLIEQSAHLQILFKRICSVPGVGPVLAVALLITTNGFTQLRDPKRLASYAGVVPFEYSSGSSIWRKPQVSHMADKKLKRLLHMGATSVIRHPGELQTYYLRKRKDGKPAMLVLNAIRNKIIHRVCAVVRNEKNYLNPLVMS
jgi:transposase